MSRGCRFYIGLYACLFSSFSNPFIRNPIFHLFINLSYFLLAYQRSAWFKAEVSCRGTVCESSSVGTFSLELRMALAVRHLLHGADGLCCQGCDSLSRFWYYLAGRGQEPMFSIAATTKLTVHRFQVHE